MRTWELRAAVLLAALALSGGAHAERAELDASLRGARVTAARAVEGAISSMLRAYATWQAANAMAPASSFVPGGLNTWDTLEGLSWQISGDADVARICLTASVQGHPMLRDAFVLSAARVPNATLVNQDCMEALKSDAPGLSRLGVAVHAARARVLVSPVSSSASLTGAAALSVPRSGSASVTVLNSGGTPLTVHDFYISEPFSLTHDCPGQLEEAQQCQVNVQTSASRPTPMVGRLSVRVGDSGEFIVPLHSTPASTAGAVVLSGQN